MNALLLNKPENTYIAEPLITFMTGGKTMNLRENSEKKP